VALFLVVVSLMAAGVLLGLGLGAWRRWARARRVRRAFGEPTGLDEGQPRTLRGVLRSPGGSPGQPIVTTTLPASVATAELATVGARTVSEAELCLITEDGTTVLIEGPLQVLCGGVEARWDRLALGEPDGALDDAVRLLRQGDPVVACGRLVRLADERDERTYRQDASAYCLRPPHDPEWRSHPVVLAYAAAPRGAETTGWAVASGVTLAALFALSLAEPAPPDGVAQAAAPDPCIAELRSDLDRDASQVARQLYGCSDPLLAAETHWSLASFDDAAKAYLEARQRDPSLTPTISEIEALALAGYLGNAADVVRNMARSWYAAPKSVERDRLVCIADALDARGGPGQEDAVAALRARQAGAASQPSDCIYLWGDLAIDEEDRDKRLQHGGPWTDFELRQLLLAELDTGGFLGYPTVLEGYPLSAMTDLRAWVHLRPIALEESILERRHDVELDGGRRAALAEYAAEVAMFYAYMGEHERARHALDPLIGFADQAPRQPFVLGAIAALHIGDLERADKLMDAGKDDSHAIAKLRRVVATMRRTGRVDFAHEIETEPWSPNVELFRAGRTGDGAVVAQTLRRLGITGRQALPRIAPHLQMGKPLLRQWVNEAFPGFCRSCGLSALAEHSAARREAARVLDDDVLYRRMSARTQRALAAMLRRDLTFVFLLLERFAEG
jgi:hypothetical protein